MNLVLYTNDGVVYLAQTWHESTLEEVLENEHWEEKYKVLEEQMTIPRKPSDSAILMFNDVDDSFYYVEEETEQEETKTVKISREDFDLLDITKADTIYYITEEDGTITIEQGED